MEHVGHLATLRGLLYRAVRWAEASAYEEEPPTGRWKAEDRGHPACRKLPHLPRRFQKDPLSTDAGGRVERASPNAMSS